MLREDKINDVVRGAREVFLEHGFAGASVTQIANAAHVSKATMYAYFPTKTALFVEVVSRECDMLAQELEAKLRDRGTAEETLRSFSGVLIGFVFSDPHMRLYRICVSEAGRFPKIGQLFLDSGPKRVRRILARYLDKLCETETVRIPDTFLAADQFIQLSFARILTDRLFEGRPPEDEATILAMSENATRAFLAIYGTDVSE